MNFSILGINSAAVSFIRKYARSLRHAFAVIGTFFIGTACFGEEEVLNPNIDESEYLSVAAFISPESRQQAVFLSKLVPITKFVKTNIIEDAKVSLKEVGASEFKDFTFKSEDYESFYALDSAELIIKGGKEYDLKILYKEEGLEEEVRAIARVPEQIRRFEVSKVGTVPVPFSDLTQSNHKTWRIKGQFDDNPNEDNSYRIILYHIVYQIDKYEDDDGKPVVDSTRRSWPYETINVTDEDNQGGNIDFSLVIEIYEEPEYDGPPEYEPQEESHEVEIVVITTSYDVYRYAGAVDEIGLGNPIDPRETALLPISEDGYAGVFGGYRVFKHNIKDLREVSK